MALREKEMAMEEFKDGETDILVSTPVVEVGIDVPNATVMLIDGAERFGLAQLHQFRGRVGRGKHLSHCLLLAEDAGKDARERLKIVERVGDGFELAEEDLRIRGPGEYLGTRQSGLPNLKVAKVTDQDLILLARQEAAGILDADPDLTHDEHAPLAQHLADSTTHLVGEMS
jgi:ATP-dependent DNA helicase RecG